MIIPSIKVDLDNTHLLQETLFMPQTFFNKVGFGWWWWWGGGGGWSMLAKTCINFNTRVCMCTTVTQRPSSLTFIPNCHERINTAVTDNTLNIWYSTIYKLLTGYYFGNGCYKLQCTLLHNSQHDSKCVSFQIFLQYSQSNPHSQGNLVAS